MAKAPLMEASGWRNSSTPISRLSAQAPRRFPDLKSRSIPISATGNECKGRVQGQRPEANPAMMAPMPESRKVQPSAPTHSSMAA